MADPLFQVKAVSCFARVSCCAIKMTLGPTDYNSLGPVSKAVVSMSYNEECTYMVEHTLEIWPNAVFSASFHNWEE